MFDGALGRKKLLWRKIHESVVLHGLLCVAGERRFVRQLHHTDVSRDNRAAVLPTLPVFFFIGWEGGIRRIWRASAVVHAH